MSIALTPREQEVYKAIVEHDCYTPKEIRKFVKRIKPETASTYMRQVVRKLGYRTITELVIKEKAKHDHQRQA